MNIEIKMPDLATTDDEVTLVRWLIPTGQEVRVGQPLFEIETDKASMEVESVAGGRLQSVYVQAGERVGVGQAIAVIVTDQTESAASPSNTARQAMEVLPDLAARSSEKPRASMFARNKARLQDDDQARGIALTPVQREAASRLQAAKQTVPHFYLLRSANAEGLVRQRSLAPGKLLWDAFFVIAVAKAARVYERMRYRFDGEQLTRVAGDQVGVAVDLDNELFVIPIEQPLDKSPLEISREIEEQLPRHAQGDPGIRRMGTPYLTISNLGGSGIESFAAIINPPASAVLAVGKINPSVQVREAQIVIEQRVQLTLSVDHRAHTGKYAAAFLQHIVSELEAF